jgi:hypothetical protein
VRTNRFPRTNPATVVQHWNTAYRVGQVVDLRNDNGSVTRTATRSLAWVMGGHSAVVMVEGRTCGYDLTRMTPIVEPDAA